LLFFAAIYDVWRAPGGQDVAQVAPVTCEPNADVAPIHHRMGVLLDPKDIPIWLGADVEAAKALMRPWPEGLLQVRKVEADEVDWNAP
jgi:putative SOS response-associated peptidase YedK